MSPAALPAEDGQQRDYPAYAAAFFPDCILAVAAISQDNDMLTGFSNYGQVVRIAAPVSLCFQQPLVDCRCVKLRAFPKAVGDGKRTQSSMAACVWC